MKTLITIIALLFISGSVSAQNVGVGTDNPAEFFSVGSSSPFRVNANGNLVRINDVQYNFPSSQATSGSVLANDGSGNLSWTKVTTGNISATGTANNTTFLRGDGAWAAPAGGGGGTLLFNVTTVGSFAVGNPNGTWLPITINTSPFVSGVYNISVSGVYLFSLQGTINSGVTLSAQLYDGTNNLGGSAFSIGDLGATSGLRNYIFMQYLTAGTNIQFRLSSATTSLSMTEVRIIGYRL